MKLCVMQRTRVQVLLNIGHRVTPNIVKPAIHFLLNMGYRVQAKRKIFPILRNVDFLRIRHASLTDLLVEIITGTWKSVKFLQERI